jgi:hypothetical protein
MGMGVRLRERQHRLHQKGEQRSTLGRSGA